MRVCIRCLVVLLSLSATVASAFEPVSALDDGFAVPSPGNMAESGYSWPGSESLAGKSYAVLAWKEPFGMDELAVTSVHAGVSAGRAGASLSFSSSGFDLYGDDQEKLGLSYLLANDLSAGARFTRSSMRIKGFGDTAAFSADAGLIWKPVNALTLAVSVEDLTGAKLGDSREPLDGATRVSGTWHVLDGFTILGSMKKVRRFDTSLALGFLTTVAGPLTIGVCGGTEPDRVEFLAEIELGSIRFTYRGSWHPDLGMTHGGALAWGGILGE